MGAEGGAAAGAVGCYPVALVDQALVPERLYDPPEGLNVGVVKGDVGVFHVQPEADSLGEFLPALEVAQDAFTAANVELIDPELLDLGLIIEAQFLLYLQLDRQAVGIPASLAEGAESLHCLVAGDDVLVDAGEDMMNARVAVDSRRPIVEGKLRAVLMELGALFKDAVLLPEIQDMLLHLGEAHLTANRFEHIFLSQPIS